MPKGFTYILECSDGTYYTGSTIDLEKRLDEHEDGKGSNHTKKRLPVQLVYVEEFQCIDDAFNREKQIQGWSRKKKEALISENFESLPSLSMAYRDRVASRASATRKARASATKESKNPVEKVTIQSVPEALEGTNVKDNKFFSSNGKLLLTGEYLVLNGAKSLALPTTYSQQLFVKPYKDQKIKWESYDENNNIWFTDNFLVDDILRKDFNSANDISQRLIQILKSVYILNPRFFYSNDGFKIKTTQDFNRTWGLGTSSTLINNIANWANVDAYKLLELTFGGSGYDIACAQHNSAITYQLLNNKPIVTEIDFNPNFKDAIYFVYLNQKQNSREGIANYKKFKDDLSTHISAVNNISEQLIYCTHLTDFEILIREHEDIISKIINQKPVKEKLFPDFKGAIKSLGAWGGDFVLATSQNNPESYFKSKGYHTILPYSQIIKA